MSTNVSLLMVCYFPYSQKTIAYVMAIWKYRAFDCRGGLNPPVIIVIGMVNSIGTVDYGYATHFAMVAMVHANAAIILNWSCYCKNNFHVSVFDTPLQFSVDG